MQNSGSLPDVVRPHRCGTQVHGRWTRTHHGTGRISVRQNGRAEWRVVRAVNSSRPVGLRVTSRAYEPEDCQAPGPEFLVHLFWGGTENLHFSYAPIG